MKEQSDFDLAVVTKLLREGKVLYSTGEKGALVNPFDVLALHAIEEHEAGQTRNLRGFGADLGFDLDGQGTGGERCQL